MRPLPTDAQGRAIACEFRYLNKCDDADAKQIAQWLRDLAADVADAEFRAKCDHLFTAGYCRPLGVHPAGRASQGEAGTFYP
jgi:hypothetical protein